MSENKILKRDQGAVAGEGWAATNGLNPILEARSHLAGIDEGVSRIPVSPFELDER